MTTVAGEHARVEPDGASDFSEAAKLIRQHLWLGDIPPSYPHAPKGHRWNMNRELSVYRLLRKEFGSTAILEAIPRLRGLLGIKNGSPCTLALINGDRGRLKEILHGIEKERLPLATDGNVRLAREGRPVGSIIEDLD